MKSRYCNIWVKSTLTNLITIVYSIRADNYIRRDCKTTGGYAKHAFHVCPGHRRGGGTQRGFHYYPLLSCGGNERQPDGLCRGMDKKIALLELEHTNKKIALLELEHTNKKGFFAPKKGTSL